MQEMSDFQNNHFSVHRAWITQEWWSSLDILEQTDKGETQDISTREET